MKQNFSARIVPQEEVYAAHYLITVLPYIFDTVIAIARSGFPNYASKRKLLPNLSKIGYWSVLLFVYVYGDVTKLVSDKLQ